MATNWIHHYNELAKKHSDSISQSGYMIDGQPISEEVINNWIKFEIANLDIHHGNVLLDVGCGSGIFLKKFKNYTTCLYGVDTSEAQIKNAAQNCPDAHLRVGNSLDAKFGEILFDRIFCNSVFLLFESLQYSRKVIEYFLSISSKNAKILIGDLPLPTAETTNQNGFRRKTKGVALEVQHYPIDYLIQLCASLNIRGHYIKQTIEGKLTATFRYDFLIDKSTPFDSII